MKKKKMKKEPGHDRSELQENVGHTGSYKSGDTRKIEQRDQQKAAETNKQTDRERGNNNTNNWEQST